MAPSVADTLQSMKKHGAHIRLAYGQLEAPSPTAGARRSSFVKLSL
jgi:hypothetical protein